MSRPKLATFTCACGTTFDAEVYRSVNVSTEPFLKEKLWAGQFNVVRCPACGQPMPADVPFLYHDLAAELMVWVYPASSSDQAVAIREKIRQSRAILGTVLPDYAIDAERDVVFGIDALIGWLDRTA